MKGRMVTSRKAIKKIKQPVQALLHQRMMYVWRRAGPVLLTGPILQAKSEPCL